MSILTAVSEARSNESLLIASTVIKRENPFDHFDLIEMHDIEKTKSYLQYLYCST